MAPITGFITLWLALYVSVAQGVTKDQIVKRLLKDYDNTVLPDNEGQPTKVEVNYYVRDFYLIDHSDTYIGSQLTFRQKWNDRRLSYPESEFAYLMLSDPKKLWLPDLFFSNSRKGYFNMLMEPNVLIRIHPNGDVLYSRRVTADFKCNTDSRMFPLNKLTCPIIVASYGYTTDDVTLEWRADSPVQLSKNLNVSAFRVSLFATGYCHSKTITGEYACLRGSFFLERHFGFVFYLLYLPPLSLVLLGWVTFFFHRRDTKVRLSLLLVSLLLASLCCGHAVWQDPDRLVMTAADVWSGLCLGFVLYALMHFVVTRNLPCVVQICGYDKDEETTTNDISLQPMVQTENAEQGAGDQNKMKSKFQATSARFRHLMAKKGNRADVIARMLYPTAFIIFNIIYWAVYNRI